MMPHIFDHLLANFLANDGNSAAFIAVRHSAMAIPRGAATT